MRSANEETGSVAHPAAWEENDPRERATVGVEPISITPVIVAVDGGAASLAALRLATDLAGLLRRVECLLLIAPSVQ